MTPTDTTPTPALLPVHEVYDDRERTVGWKCSDCGRLSAYKSSLVHLENCSNAAWRTRHQLTHEAVECGDYLVVCGGKHRVANLHYGEVGVQVNERFWRCTVTGEQLHPDLVLFALLPTLSAGQPMTEAERDKIRKALDFADNVIYSEFYTGKNPDGSDHIALDGYECITEALAIIESRKGE